MRLVTTSTADISADSLSLLRVAELAAVRSDTPYVYRRMEQPGGKQRPVVRSREGQTVS